MTDRQGDWIQTYTGVCFYPFDARVEEVVLEDIAHGLSNLCRFAGQIRCFYSVAQHSVLVAKACVAACRDPSDEISRELGWLGLWGLLHDAHEAYTVDVPRPIKHDPVMAGYQRLCRDVQRVIGEKFELGDKPDLVRLYDNVLLATEKRDLVAASIAKPWAPLPDPLPEVIEPVGPEAAEKMFLEAFEGYERMRRGG